MMKVTDPLLILQWLISVIEQFILINFKISEVLNSIFKLKFMPDGGEQGALLCICYTMYVTYFTRHNQKYCW